MEVMTSLDPLSTGPVDAIGPTPVATAADTTAEGGFSRLVDEAGQALDGHDGETGDDGQDSPLGGQDLPPSTATAGHGAVPAERALLLTGDPVETAGTPPAGKAPALTAPTEAFEPDRSDGVGRRAMSLDHAATGGASAVQVQGVVGDLRWTERPTGRPEGGTTVPIDSIARAARSAKTGHPSQVAGSLPVIRGGDGDMEAALPMQAQGLGPDRSLLPGQSPVPGPSSDAPRPDAFQALVHGGGTGDGATSATVMVDQGNGHAPSPVSAPAGAPSGTPPTPPAPAPSPSANVPQWPMTSTLGQAAWADELGQRIHWFVGQNVQRAELLLHPAHLGTVEISIVMQHDHVQVSLQSHHAQVREAMEAALPRLREQFQEGGGQTTVQVDISGRDDRSGDGTGTAPRQAAPYSESDPGSEPDALRPMTSMVTNGGSGLLDRYA